jgi:hypothetical protein
MRRNENPLKSILYLPSAQFSLEVIDKISCRFIQKDTSGYTNRYTYSLWGWDCSIRIEERIGANSFKNVKPIPSKKLITPANPGMAYGIPQDTTVVWRAERTAIREHAKRPTCLRVAASAKAGNAAGELFQQPP